MSAPPGPDWPRLLRPLTLDGEPLAVQLQRRRGVAVVASGLFGGLMAFFLAIFAGFGQARIGLAVAALGVPIVARIWAGYGQLARTVRDYSAARVDPPAGRGSPTGATPREVDPGR